MPSVQHNSRTAAVIFNLITEHLAKILADHIALLKGTMDAQAASDSNDNSEKFQICKMDVGDIRDFHKGLASRIGNICFYEQLCFSSQNHF